MIESVLLYISAASDLEAEREVIDQAVTEIPISLGWRITQSPIHGEALDLAAVQNAHSHLLLLGSDIRAPIGQEWLAARRSGRIPSLFLKEDANHTPAAEAFIRYIQEQSAWQKFKDRADLRLQVLKMLSSFLMEKAVYFSLSPREYEKLQEWRERLEKMASQKPDDRSGGAGESGVIISPERFTPPGGVLIGQKQGQQKPGENP